MIDERYVDMDYIRNNPNKNWNLYYLSCNKQLTVKDIDTLKLPNASNNWDWCTISRSIDIQEVRNNPHKPWDKLYLSQNLQLTVKDVETLVLPKSQGKWNWYLISLYIDIQEVINNPHKPWDIDRLKINISHTEKILEFFSAGLLKHLQKNIPKFQYHTDVSVKCDC